MNVIKGLGNKLGNAIKGFFVVLGEDLSFKVEVFIFFPISLLIVFFIWPLDIIEIFMLSITFGLVLITELINTAIEVALDKLHPIRHRSIAVSKDALAASVAIAMTLYLATLIAVVLMNV